MTTASTAPTYLSGLLKSQVQVADCPEMDADFYRRASTNAARLHAARVERDHLAWINRTYPLGRAASARHARQLCRAEHALREMAGLLIAGGSA